MKPKFLNVSLQRLMTMCLFLNHLQHQCVPGAPASTTEPPDTLRQSNAREENKRLNFKCSEAPSPILGPSYLGKKYYFCFGFWKTVLKFVLYRNCLIREPLYYRTWTKWNKFPNMSNTLWLYGRTHFTPSNSYNIYFTFLNLFWL